MNQNAPYAYVFKDSSGNPYIEVAGTVGATAKGTFRLDTGSRFFMTGLSGIAVSQSAEGTDQKECLVELKEIGGERPLMSAPAHWDSVVGSAERPHWFSHELEVGGNREIEVEITNRTTTATRVYLTALGYKQRPLDGRSNVGRDS